MEILFLAVTFALTEVSVKLQNLLLQSGWTAHSHNHHKETT